MQIRCEHSRMAGTYSGIHSNFMVVSSRGCTYSGGCSPTSSTSKTDHKGMDGADRISPAVKCSKMHKMTKSYELDHYPYELGILWPSKPWHSFELRTERTGIPHPCQCDTSTYPYVDVPNSNCAYLLYATVLWWLRIPNSLLNLLKTAKSSSGMCTLAQLISGVTRCDPLLFHSYK